MNGAVRRMASASRWLVGRGYPAGANTRASSDIPSRGHGGERVQPLGGLPWALDGLPTGGGRPGVARRARVRAIVPIDVLPHSSALVAVPAPLRTWWPRRWRIQLLQGVQPCQSRRAGRICGLHTGHPRTNFADRPSALDEYPHSRCHRGRDHTWMPAHRAGQHLQGCCRRRGSPSSIRRKTNASACSVHSRGGGAFPGWF